jgi:hypothetical protein
MTENFTVSELSLSQPLYPLALEREGGNFITPLTYSETKMVK